MSVVRGDIRLNFVLPIINSHILISTYSSGARPICAFFQCLSCLQLPLPPVQSTQVFQRCRHSRTVENTQFHIWCSIYPLFRHWQYCEDGPRIGVVKVRCHDLREIEGNPQRSRQKAMLWQMILMLILHDPAALVWTEFCKFSWNQITKKYT